MDVPPMAQSQPQPQFYRKPPASSPDAYRIWNECCLGDIMEAMDIYWALDTWARLNCLIEMREERPYVFWISPSGVRHECFADTFAHWFLCACEEINPQVPQVQVVSLPQPLTPANEIQPTFTVEPLTEEEEAKNEIIFHEIRDTENDAFHEVEKIDDSADNAIEDNVIIYSLKDEEPFPLTFEEIVHMNLEQFLESTKGED